LLTRLINIRLLTMKLKLLVSVLLLFTTHLTYSVGDLLGSKKIKEEKQSKELKEKIKKLKLDKELLATKNALEKEKLRTELRKLRHKNQKLQLLNEIERQKIKQKQALLYKRKSKIDEEMLRIKLDKARLSLKAFKKEAILAHIEMDLVHRRKIEQWNKQVNHAIKYKLNPIVKNSIEITDRRIKLNEVITYRLADHIADRINFYNNKSEKYPIFLVIDMSPGGSVIAGHKIIKAMEASRAPVYVVVKSYAASMAAVITARAKYSYVYPNAIILHHQMSGYNVGNLTQQKERLKMAKEWMQRLYTPVAKKMGMKLSGFIKKMYEKNSDGDWQEFGNNAVGLGWVTSTVSEIKEKSIKKIEEKKKMRFPFFFQAKEKIDSQGKRYMKLPHLSRHDFYFLDNRDNYFRY